ncbi:MAG: hypothetical protein K2H64_01080 [Desulfovibrio sp.]|nr:hypothetical protein [Desulfovibrio sp.]
MKHEFLARTRLALDFAYRPENWDEIRFAYWLREWINAPLLTHDLKRAFVAAWLDEALKKIPLSLAIRKKATVRDILETRIDEIRRRSDEEHGQRFLTSPETNRIFKVDDSFVHEFSPTDYFPAERYNPAKYGNYEFKKHYYPVIGARDSSEEFECAQYLDNEAQAGRIKFWIRNLAKSPGSFYLRKIDGRFYPDFVCFLPDDTTLVVARKGADRWDTPKVKADREIGELWVACSNDLRQFVMVKNKDWSAIGRILRREDGERDKTQKES